MYRPPSITWSNLIRLTGTVRRVPFIYRRQNLSSRANGYGRRPPPPPPRGRRFFDSRYLLAFTTAAGFQFKKNGISDERLAKAESAKDEFDKRDEVSQGWEVLVAEPDFRAYRRRVDGPYEMYEYKCAGTYRDISPRTFLDVQNDLKYRHEWDTNILELTLLKEEDDHELIHWISKYPYPMYPREYIYARRTWVSQDEAIVVVESEVVPSEVFPSPPNSKNVRVETYTSRMAVRAHSDWNQKGLDYILTYSDNPEANIPRYIYNWLVNQGGPYFLKQVHAAALEIERTGRALNSSLDGALSLRKEKEVKEKEKEEKQKPNEEECFIEIGQSRTSGEKKSEKRKDSESKSEYKAECNDYRSAVSTEEEEHPAAKAVQKVVKQVSEAVEKAVQRVKDELPKKD